MSVHLPRTLQAPGSIFALPKTRSRSRDDRQPVQCPGRRRLKTKLLHRFVGVCVYRSLCVYLRACVCACTLRPGCRVQITIRGSEFIPSTGWDLASSSGCQACGQASFPWRPRSSPRRRTSKNTELLNMPPCLTVEVNRQGARKHTEEMEPNDRPRAFCIRYP